MSFLISHKDSPYPHWEYLNEDSGDSLKIVPERGGLITSWKCNGREILYLDQLRFADKSKSVRGGIPVLFPICGDLLDNQIVFENSTYFLKQHGFARDSSWELNTPENKSRLILRLSETKSSLLVYPFEFNLQMEISLRDNSLEILVTVKNNSNRIMPFSFGLHPYFLVNDLNEVRINGLSEDCVNQKNLEISKTADILKSLSNGIDLLSGPTNCSTLYDIAEKTSLTMITQKPLDLNVIWTDPPRKMVCLEPWTSPRNSLITGDRTIKLKQGNLKQLSCKFICNKVTSSPFICFDCSI